MTTEYQQQPEHLATETTTNTIQVDEYTNSFLFTFFHTPPFPPLIFFCFPFENSERPARTASHPPHGLHDRVDRPNTHTACDTSPTPDYLVQTGQQPEWKTYGPAPHANNTWTQTTSPRTTGRGTTTRHTDNSPCGPPNSRTQHTVTDTNPISQPVYPLAASIHG